MNSGDDMDVEKKPERIGIICVGNPLMADEGVGTAVAAALAEHDLGDNVEVMDVGSVGMSLLHIIKDLDAAYIIDAANFGGEPGVIRTFGPDEVSSVKIMRKESLHEADLIQVLKLSESLGELPEKVLIIAVQFGKVEMAMEMTEPVKAAVPRVVELVLERLT
jgi:hydrogenase maturation protease